MLELRFAFLALCLLSCSFAGCTSGDDGPADESDGGGSGAGGSGGGDAGTPAPATCSNGRMDGDEADIDCGGSCPTGCGEDQTCDADRDCESGYCHPESGLCAEPSCGDGFQNQDETDVDCGGSCEEKCRDGRACETGEDCVSGFCNAENECATPSCSDGLRNQDETDVDCGGTCGDSCADGEDCASAADCASAFCTPDTSVCATASCSDGYENQDETDTDCGGTCGATCDDGQQCGHADDCENAFCTPDTGVCVTPSCDDGYLNQDETDTDCGGEACGKTCEDGERCEDAGDCVTDLCHPTSSRCAPMSCANDMLDDGETDVDCGGPCGPSCMDDEDCLAHGDCVSGFCNPDTDVCATPTCEDGFRNQDETDVDCGGEECGATCENGDDCEGHGDCESGFCNPDNEECAAPTCDDGFENGDELDVDCGGTLCMAGSCDVGENCANHDDCESGFCNPNTDVCAMPACGDGFKNQNETDVDCGNICGATCTAGKSCDSVSGDCMAGLNCESNVCTASCTDLNPMNDGSSAARQALIISEIDIGSHIELYNNTDSDIALGGSPYYFCSRPDYPRLSDIAAGTTVPAGGYATIPWPSALNSGNSDAGGELVLYVNGIFGDGDNIMDYVCWGTGRTNNRKTEAGNGGKWSGGCTPAITGGALHRLPNTTGTSAASYDTSSAPTPLNCTP